MKIIYNTIIIFYCYAIYFSALISVKSRAWVNGRRHIFSKLEKLKDQENIVWFHCSSLGEFEQGRSVIQAYKDKYPDHKLLLTFFSSSGFNVCKNYKIVDWVFCLPLDTVSNAKKFLNIIKPIKVIFIKYDFWFNYMREINLAGIPLYFISSVFRKKQIFFKFRWCALQLQHATHFFVQDEQSRRLLSSIGINSVTVSGDTRFDTVRRHASNKKAYPLIRDFTNNNLTIIFGSTWPKDEELICRYISSNPQHNYIIAPHEINNISFLKNKTNALIYSKLNPKNINSSNILIIDSIGILSAIYRYADIAYIGGGFGKGIHNILEPASYDLPIIFGPNYYKFNEAYDLISLGAAISINNYLEFENAIKIFSHYENNITNNYITENCGATKIIMKCL